MSSGTTDKEVRDQIMRIIHISRVSGSENTVCSE